MRDGNQAVGVNFSVDDKIKIAKKLSDFGINYIEGGWPNAVSQAEVQFFRRMMKERFRSAITAFGMTRKPGLKPENDRNLEILLSAEANYITLMGKSSVFHVRKVLGTTLDENIRMVFDSVAYLRGKGAAKIFDASQWSSNSPFSSGFLRSARYGLVN